MHEKVSWTPYIVPEPLTITIYGMEGTLCYWLTVRYLFQRICGWPGCQYR